MLFRSKDKSIKIKINKDAINWLIDNGFDDKMGARPLQRVIDKEIKRDLAKLMLFGELKNGGILEIKVEDNKLKLIPIVKKVAKQTESITEDEILDTIEELV